MRYKALKSFCGIVSACAGDTFAIADASLANDLMRAGHIICIEDELTPRVKRTAAVKKTATRGKKTNG